MWVYAKNGFLSIVQHRDKPDTFIVRARVSGDIQNYWPHAEVEVDTGTDYKFRAFIKRDEVTKVVSKMVDDIDYGNFKNSIKDPYRSICYSWVWEIMVHFQHHMENENARRKNRP